VDKCDSDGSLESIKKDRGYTYEDVIEVSPEKLPNFEMMVYFWELRKLLLRMIAWFHMISS